MTRTFLAAAAFFATLAPAALAQTTKDLSDPEVAHVAVTANSIDIDLGKLAQARSHNAEVRQFAGTMITDHTIVNQKAGELAGRLGVTPKDNGVSQSLQTGATDAKKKLEGLAGVDFDRGYMDREIAYHQAVLDALDGLLIPTTENAELKSLLVTVRPAIAHHLEMAKRVRSGLNAAQ